MFRVPEDGNRPTFDRTFKVGFGRWLTSRAADRREWARRRDAAAALAAQTKRQRIADRHGNPRRDVRAQPPPARVPASTPSRIQPDRSLTWLIRLETWTASIQLFWLLIPTLAVLALCGVCGWAVLVR